MTHSQARLPGRSLSLSLVSRGRCPVAPLPLPFPSSAPPPSLLYPEDTVVVAVERKPVPGSLRVTIRSRSSIRAVNPMPRPVVSKLSLERESRRALADRLVDCSPTTGWRRPHRLLAA